MNLTCSGCKREGMKGYRMVGTINLQQRTYALDCRGIRLEHKTLCICSLINLLDKKKLWRG